MEPSLQTKKPGKAQALSPKVILPEGVPGPVTPPKAPRSKRVEAVNPNGPVGMTCRGCRRTFDSLKEFLEHPACHPQNIRRGAQSPTMSSRFPHGVRSTRVIHVERLTDGTVVVVNPSSLGVRQP